MRAVKVEDEKPTMSIRAAASELGVGLNQAYAAARNGELPVLRVGKRMLVLTVPFRRMLRGEGKVSGQ